VLGSITIGVEPSTHRRTHHRPKFRSSCTVPRFLLASRLLGVTIPTRGGTFVLHIGRTRRSARSPGSRRAVFGKGCRNSAAPTRDSDRNSSVVTDPLDLASKRDRIRHRSDRCARSLAPNTDRTPPHDRTHDSDRDSATRPPTSGGAQATSTRPTGPSSNSSSATAVAATGRSPRRSGSPRPPCAGGSSGSVRKASSRCRGHRPVQLGFRRHAMVGIRSEGDSR